MLNIKKLSRSVSRISLDRTVQIRIRIGSKLIILSLILLVNNLDTIIPKNNVFFKLLGFKVLEEEGRSYS